MLYCGDLPRQKDRSIATMLIRTRDMGVSDTVNVIIEIEAGVNLRASLGIEEQHTNIGFENRHPFIQDAQKKLQKEIGQD
jgi:hypothetical protein